jgi:hypothetical protein
MMENAHLQQAAASITHATAFQHNEQLKAMSTTQIIIQLKNICIAANASAPVQL